MKEKELCHNSNRLLDGVINSKYPVECPLCGAVRAVPKSSIGIVGFVFPAHFKVTWSKKRARYVYKMGWVFAQAEPKARAVRKLPPERFVQPGDWFMMNGDPARVTQRKGPLWEGYANGHHMEWLKNGQHSLGHPGYDLARRAVIEKERTREN